ncbi:MAG: hypothetical protein ACT4PO_06190 [Actinomycetota bacterium]
MSIDDIASEDMLWPKEALRDWSTSAMDLMYLDVYEQMFHEPPPLNEDGLRPKEHWRCSSLGRCLRYQVLERSGLERAEISAASRRRMDIGSQIHWIHTLKKARWGLLLGREIAITDPELHLAGHIDLVWGGPVQEIPPEWRIRRKPDWIFFLEELRRRGVERWGEVAPVTVEELKTVGGWGFRTALRDGRSDYRTQLGGYALLAEAHPDLLPATPARYQIVVFNRESGAMREIRMRPSWVEEARERVVALNEAWATGRWPPCTCGATEDLAWEATLCAFPNPDGDGCCGQTLLDRLEASLT